jgi:zinc protease
MTTRLSIGEGLKVALLPKSTRGKAVRLQLTLRYGSPEGLGGRVAACEALPTMMVRGTRELSRQQIQDKLDENRSTLSASGSAGQVTFNIETDREHLPQVLDLLRQVLRQPTLPASELDLIKQARIAAYEKQLNDPQALAVNQVNRHVKPWPESDPRYIPTIPEELKRIKSLTRDQVQELYENFLSAEHGELAIVGDFDADETLKAFRGILAGWTSEKEYERLAAKAVDVSGGSDRIETPDKANAVYFSAMSMPMRDDAPDFPAMTIGNFILGGGSLSSRLADRVRQQEGLSYGVASGFNASNLDQRAAFYAYAIYNPTNVEKVRTAIREEIDRLLADGVTEKELAAAKDGFLQKQEVARSDDSQLAAILAETLEAGRTMTYYSDLEKSVRGLTTEDVLEALREHLKPEKLYTVVAGDFAKDKDAASE